MDGNISWAALAPVLILTFVEQIWTRQECANATAMHDVWMATAMISIQAEALGLRTDHMAGIQHDVIKATYAGPEKFNVVSAITVGHQGIAELLTEEKDRDREPNLRTRKSLDEIVFVGALGTPAKLGSKSTHQEGNSAAETFGLIRRTHPTGLCLTASCSKREAARPPARGLGRRACLAGRRAPN
jgi:hypothetical protein